MEVWKVWKCSSSILCFLNVYIMPLHLYGRPISFCQLKEKPQKDFGFYGKGQNVEIVFIFCFVESAHPQQWACPYQSPSQRIKRSISVLSCHSFELCLWTPVFILFCLCICYQDVSYDNCFFTLYYFNLQKGVPGGSWQRLHLQYRSRRTCRLDSWVVKTPWEGNGNPLQYSGLENLMDGRAWWAAAHGVAQS